MLGAGLALPLSGPLAAVGTPAVTTSRSPLIPPYLSAGDIIGITSPAGYITQQEIQPAIRVLQRWGFNIRVGSTIGKRDFSFGGTDAERLQDLQAMLNDTGIKAILCARGGYGCARILDQLDLNTFSRHPKWVIGFSDITALLCHIHRHTGVATIHSKMCNSFPDSFEQADAIVQDTILSIRHALCGDKMQYTAPVHASNRTGSGSGLLVGGNLSMLQSIASTNSEIDTIGKILFLEEVGEYLYSLDRMMGNLQRSRKLDNLAGLIIGGFNRIKPDDPGEEFGRNLYEIVLDKVRDFKYPVCFDFPTGHQKNNYALKCGVMHRLDVGKERVSLGELQPVI